MARNVGISNYVFPEDRQAEEDALTEKLYEYAMQQPKASALGARWGYGMSKNNMNAYARDIQYENTQSGEQHRKKVKENQDAYLKEAANWLSKERRIRSDAEILDAIKNDPVFRRRIMTLQNPDTFNDSFWFGY